MDDTTVIDKPSRSADGDDDGAVGRGDDFNKILDLLGGMSSRLGELERRQDSSAAELSAALGE